MRKNRWKIWFVFALLFVAGGGLLYVAYRAGYISHIRIRSTKEGWLCTGPFQYGLDYPCTRPILSGKKIVVVEKYKRQFYREGFKILESKKYFLRDTYYITALALSNGDMIYRIKINIKSNPLQILGVWAWGENMVVWGYYQEEPGLNNRIFSVSILNSYGNILKRFPLDVKPTAVDEKNNLLICGSRLLELPSGKEKFQTQTKLLVDIVSDKNGNVYILRRLSGISEGDKNIIYDALVEKYSCIPWEKLWSVKIPGTAEGYPIMLRYEKGLLWYAFYDERGGTYPEDRRKWASPLDSETGARIETERRCDPYQIEAEVDGKLYIVKLIKNKLHVKTVSK